MHIDRGGVVPASPGRVIAIKVTLGDKGREGGQKIGVTSCMDDTLSEIMNCSFL